MTNIGDVGICILYNFLEFSQLIYYYHIISLHFQLRDYSFLIVECFLQPHPINNILHLINEVA